jgi:hypothetical protein
LRRLAQEIRGIFASSAAHCATAIVSSSRIVIPFSRASATTAARSDTPLMAAPRSRHASQFVSQSNRRFRPQPNQQLAGQAARSEEMSRRPLRHRSWKLAGRSLLAPQGAAKDATAARAGHTHARDRACHAPAALWSVLARPDAPIGVDQRPRKRAFLFAGGFPRRLGALALEFVGKHTVTVGINDGRLYLSYSCGKQKLSMQTNPHLFARASPPRPIASGSTATSAR